MIEKQNRSAAGLPGARGASVTVLAQGVKLAIQLLSLVILSRLLTPADFGLVAMVAIFLALGDLLRDFGMSTVGLQRSDLSQQQASNLFWVNSFLGLGSAITLTISTPLIVALYSDDRLWQVVPALAPVLLLGGLATQFRVQLARSMRFVALNLVEVSGQILMLVISVTAALVGLQYWAIVISNVLGAFVLLAGFWIFSRWRPSLPRRGFSSRDLVRDGGAFGLAHFLTYLSSFADTLVIGIRWGAGSVGIYDRGFQLFSLPGSKIVGPLTQVIIPAVNRAVASGRSIEDTFLRLQFSLSLVVVWFFATSAATADWWIPALLGPEWQETVAIFQILAVGGMVSILSNVNYWRIIMGNLGMSLVHYNLVTKLMTVGLIVAAAFVNLQMVALAVSLSLVLSWPIALLWFGRVAGWPSQKYLAEGLRVILPGGFAYLIGLCFSRTIGFDFPWTPILTVLLVFFVMFAGICFIPGGLSRLRMSTQMLTLAFPNRWHR